MSGYSFLHNLMTDIIIKILFLKRRITDWWLKGDWIGNESWLNCLPFSTFQSLKGHWKPHFSKNWNVGFFPVRAVIQLTRNCESEGFWIDFVNWVHVGPGSYPWSCGQWTWGHCAFPCIYYLERWCKFKCETCESR